MRATGGAPESQSRVYHRYSLCSRWVRGGFAGGAPESRSVRRWVGGWVSGEMGSRDGDRG
jgi:hypothetical protein